VQLISQFVPIKRIRKYIIFNMKSNFTNLIIKKKRMKKTLILQKLSKSFKEKLIKKLKRTN